MSAISPSTFEMPRIESASPTSYCNGCNSCNSCYVCAGCFISPTPDLEALFGALASLALLTWNVWG